jgi:cobalt-zinc-cadmium resistance protein CzcA
VIFVSFIIILAGFIFSFKAIGTQFLPKLDEGNIYMRVIFPYSISLSKAHENAKRVRDVLMEFEDDVMARKYYPFFFRF